jgi:arylsulfatase A-like enzyme
MVSHIDLAATFLDFAGIARPVAMDSRSLRPVLEGKTREHREYVRSGLWNWRMVLEGRFKLVRGYVPGRKGSRPDARPEPAPMLFDLKLDPQERLNIANEAPAQVERLSKLL